MKIAVLISGRGSNLKAIIEDSTRGSSPYSVDLVIADNQCPGLQYAKNYDIPVRIVNYNNYSNKENAEKEIQQLLEEHEIELVVLAGFMKLLTPYLVSRWTHKIINIHPSLLPAFTGLNTHQRAIQRGVKVHGCTVHFVDEGMDTGLIIAQRVVLVLPSYTAAILADKVLIEEHDVLPKVIRMIALNNIVVEHDEVLYLGNYIGNI